VPIEAEPAVAGGAKAAAEPAVDALVVPTLVPEPAAPVAVVLAVPVVDVPAVPTADAAGRKGRGCVPAAVRRRRRVWRASRDSRSIHHRRMLTDVELAISKVR
jgi:hypothetical protein